MVEYFMQKQCPVCGVDSGSLFVTQDWNRKSSAQEFEYRKCPECGLIFLANVPNNLDYFYGDTYYVPPKFEKLKKIAKAER